MDETQPRDHADAHNRDHAVAGNRIEVNISYPGLSRRSCGDGATSHLPYLGCKVARWNDAQRCHLSRCGWEHSHQPPRREGDLVARRYPGAASPACRQFAAGRCSRTGATTFASIGAISTSEFPCGEEAQCVAGNESYRDDFVKTGKIPADDDIDQPRMPQSRYPSPPALNVVLPLGGVGATVVTRHVLLGLRRCLFGRIHAAETSAVLAQGILEFRRTA